MSNRSQDSVATNDRSSTTTEYDFVDRSTPNSFQEGYWQGRDRAARDYTSATTTLEKQNKSSQLPGVLIGMLITTLIGGGAVAFMYFDTRLDTLVTETETLTETLTEQEAASEESDRQESDISRPESLTSTEAITPGSNAPALPANPVTQSEESPVESQSPEQSRHPFIPSPEATDSTELSDSPDARTEDTSSADVEIEPELN